MSAWGPLRLGWHVPLARRAWLAAAGVAPGQPSDLDVRLWGAMLPAEREEPVRTLLLAVVRGRGVSLCPAPRAIMWRTPGPSWVCAACPHSRVPQMLALGTEPPCRLRGQSSPAQIGTVPESRCRNSETLAVSSSSQGWSWKQKPLDEQLKLSVGLTRKTSCSPTGSTKAKGYSGFFDSSSWKMPSICVM